MPLISEPLKHRLIHVRRLLHAYPELSGQEDKTAGVIRAFLDELGIRYRAHVAGYGVIADIPGPAGVPCVVLRADMDALPIQEETGLGFASVYDGVMHACGHDGHTAMLLGAAVLLSETSGLPAPVRLIFQPAEETATGARAMIAAGALEGAGMIFSGHLDRHYPPGAIAVAEGAVNASSDNFTIEIIGQGAHGARPHESIDAVVVGSLMIMALQTIVSREVDPARPSVVSVGQFHAGTAPNVIAGQAKLAGTVRAQESAVRQQLLTSIGRIAEAIAHLHGAKIHISIREGTPPLINTPEMAGLARRAASDTLGEANVVPLKTANMGAEDFSYYLEHIPGAYVRFGSQVPGKEGFPAHSSKFDFDEEALEIGAAYYHAIAKLAGRRLCEQAVVLHQPRPGPS